MTRALSSTIVLASLLISTQHAVAQAINQDGNRYTTVSYADLNIHSEAGASVLLGRLKTAARAVCGPEPSIFELRETQAFAVCQKKALDRAVANVGSPELAALYGTEAGHVAEK